MLLKIIKSINVSVFPVVGQIGFIPLIQECYDPVMPKKLDNEAWIEKLLFILRSEGFQQKLCAISGYDLSLTGQVMYEI